MLKKYEREVSVGLRTMERTGTTDTVSYAGMWILIDRMQICIQDNKITKIFKISFNFEKSTKNLIFKSETKKTFLISYIILFLFLRERRIVG